MHSQLQEHTHRQWGANHAQQRAKMGVEQEFLQGKPSPVHKDKRQQVEKDNHFYPSLSKAEQALFFLVTETTRAFPALANSTANLPDFVRNIVPPDVFFQPLLLRVPSLQDPLFSAPEELRHLSSVVATEATSRTAPRGTISLLLWVLTPQPSRPETRAGLDDSRLPTARARQAGNADNRQLHQQGMPASNTSHHRQRAPGDLCQGLRGLNPAQHFHCKSTEKPSWLFSIKTVFTENNF